MVSCETHAHTHTHTHTPFITETQFVSFTINCTRRITYSILSASITKQIKGVSDTNNKTGVYLDKEAVTISLSFSLSVSHTHTHTHSLSYWSEWQSIFHLFMTKLTNGHWLQWLLCEDVCVCVCVCVCEAHTRRAYWEKVSFPESTTYTNQHRDYTSHIPKHI